MSQSVHGNKRKKTRRAKLKGQIQGLDAYRRKLTTTDKEKLKKKAAMNSRQKLGRITGRGLAKKNRKAGQDRGVKTEKKAARGRKKRPARTEEVRSGKGRSVVCGNFRGVYPHLGGRAELINLKG